MTELPHYELFPVVRCVACRCDVASVDKDGWCPGCVRKKET